MIYLLYFIHVFTCFFLILVVLLQQGKGADLSVFGGGATQAAFGARGAATLLHKLTVGGFIAFILTTMGIGFLESRSDSSVMTDAAAEERPVEAPEQPADPFALAPEEGAEEGEGVAPGETLEGAEGETPDEEPPGGDEGDRP